MYAAVIMMLAVLTPYHGNNVGDGRVYYINAHSIHPASVAYKAVVVFPCLFAR
jgi:hypothetical protein